MGQHSRISGSHSGPLRSTALAGYAGFVLIGWAGVLAPSLIRSIENTFHVSDAAFGLYFFLSALVYAAGSLSGGFLTERTGRRAVLSLGVGLIALGLAGQALASSWGWFIAAALIAGWGAGSIDGGVNGLFLDLYRDARGGALNFLHLFFSLGAFIGPFAVGQLVGMGLDWRAVVFGTGVGAAAVGCGLLAVAMPSGKHEPLESAEAVLEPSETSLLPFVALGAAICFYVAAEVGISNWLVRFLSNVPVTSATAVLSGFWGGLSLGRLLSRFIAERIDYTTFAVSCLALASLSVILALIAPWLGLEAALFALAGFFSGPVYPTIMAIGGNIYPHRLARMSGSLGAAAVFGAVGYPPIMGLMAASVGIGAGMLGAALLGIPAAAAIVLARVMAQRGRLQPVATAASRTESSPQDLTPTLGP